MIRGQSHGVVRRADLRVEGAQQIADVAVERHDRFVELGRLRPVLVADEVERRKADGDEIGIGVGADAAPLDDRLREREQDAVAVRRVAHAIAERLVRLHADTEMMALPRRAE